jgi:hypothetical protein
MRVTTANNTATAMALDGEMICIGLIMSVARHGSRLVGRSALAA